MGAFLILAIMVNSGIIRHKKNIILMYNVPCGGDNIMDEQMKVNKIDSNPNVVYANGITINFSIFEARLEFLKDTPNVVKKEITQETVADIRMSPQLAKTVATFLLQNVANYEKQFGTLPLLSFNTGDVNA